MERPPEWYCGAKKRDGSDSTCHNRAGFKTDHVGVGRCHLHGGKTPNHQASAQVELLRRECDRLGLPRDVDPGDALLELVGEAAGNVEFYRILVQNLDTHPEPDRYVEPDGDTQGYWIRGEAGLYGATYHQSNVPTGEAKPHILVVLYNEERDRLASYTKAALQAGVEERRVRLAEVQARELFSAVGKALVAAGLNEQQAERFRHELAAELRRAAEPASLAR